MKTYITMIFILLSFPLFAQGYGDSGKVEAYHSQFSFRETRFRLKRELKKKHIKVFSQIYHSQEAKKVNLDLLPTLVLIVGNPKAGTMLMQDHQDMGLYLPLKILIKENSNGETDILYQKVEVLAKENGLESSLSIAKKIDEVMDGLLKSVTMSGKH